MDLFTSDRGNQDLNQSSTTPSNETGSDDHYGGPALVAFSLMVFFVVLAFLFISAVRSAEIESAPTTSEKSIPPSRSEWKPPVAKKVVQPPLVDEERAKQIAEKWGVKLISLNLTAAHYMIDFRFRVLDEKKAGIFFDQRVKPYLFVEKSHAKLPVPMAAKVGALRTTNRGNNIKPDKIYYIVFGNPDAHVKSGEKVTMVVGDFKAEHLIVR